MAVIWWPRDSIWTGEPTRKMKISSITWISETYSCKQSVHKWRLVCMHASLILETLLLNPYGFGVGSTLSLDLCSYGGMTFILVYRNKLYNPSPSPSPSPRCNVTIEKPVDEDYELLWYIIFANILKRLISEVMWCRMFWFLHLKNDY